VERKPAFVFRWRTGKDVFESAKHAAPVQGYFQHVAQSAVGDSVRDGSSNAVLLKSEAYFGSTRMKQIYEMPL
jgi:hypothetical protein